MVTNYPKASFGFSQVELKRDLTVDHQFIRSPLHSQRGDEAAEFKYSSLCWALHGSEAALGNSK